MMAGIGCHSSPSDHDSFSIPNSAGTSSFTPLASRGATSMQAGYVAQPVIREGTAPSLQSNARPVTLQTVPAVRQAAFKREVIASSWSPVQRVSAEQPAQRSDMHVNAPIAAVNTPPTARTVVFAPRSSMPMGSPLPAGNGPILDGSEATAPGNILLPTPRPLISLPPTGFIPGSAAPLPHPDANVPREFEKMALPSYVVEPPDILLIQASNRITLRLQSIQGQHLVGPDGTVNLGIYGKVRVAGLTVEQVADAVAARLLELLPGLLRTVPELDDKGKDKSGTEGAYLKDWRRDFSSVELIKKELMVDVLVYNSKFYYVITDGGGYGQQVYPIPIRGNETVLDALANIQGLPPVANKRKVWVARATRAGQAPKILPVDWLAVTKCGSSDTNY
jgi:polysaccharide export outer membrane protein